ncbi:MAG: tetraacyldisaccharide 4'-kinase [Methylophaga sp.]|nr:tetraacyldisaccharide 4'-kinase [Methylophaga sp.]
MKWLLTSWYQPHPIRWLLWPLSALYCSIIWCRKQAYHFGLFKQHKMSVPVIVVGNISVGGTGKTPCVTWLAKQLKQAGYRPGIISRGYGGRSESYPQNVNSTSDPILVGDEPVIISRHTQCPMVVSPNRVEAAKFLLQQHNCNIIVSDDGLQHTKLGRDIEIVVVDHQRLFGNGLCLPAGPLREPLSRLKTVDFIVYNGGNANEFNMQLSQSAAINLADNTLTKTFAEFSDQAVHAVAGIGNPKRFFNQLIENKLTVHPHPFSDHHYFQPADLDFGDDAQILMTEKDAVKCQTFATENMWFIPIEATISGKLEQQIFTLLETSNNG